MKHVILIVFLCGSSLLYSQKIDFEGSVEVNGAVGSEDVIPFWMFTNSSTEFGALSNFSGTGEVIGTYDISENASVEAGGSFFYRDDVTDEFQRRELYARFQNNWLRVTLGAKASETLNEGLSATNKNFLWSNNARPIPGLLIEANEPIRISDVFGIDWGIGHYVMNDDRYVEDTRIHYKRLALVVTLNENHKLTGRIQHFAQWAGTSPEVGDLESDFSAFVDVFFARRSKEVLVDGELLNAVGNHLGSYLLDYEFNTNIGAFSISHEHPFEDGSGTRLANFPDGVWAVFFEPSNSRIFDAFQYEFITTTDQGNSPTAGVDNYFNNSVYRSGWTYEQNIIGLPFVLFDRTTQIGPLNSPIVGNRIVAHNFGASGQINKIAWKLKSTAVTNKGLAGVPFDPELRNWYNYLLLSYTNEAYGTISLSAGADFGNLTDTNFGGGIGYRYSF